MYIYVTTIIRLRTVLSQVILGELFLNHPFKTFITPAFYAVFYLGFPGGSEVKVSASNSGDPGSIPGLGRSPGEGNGSPLQYSCLENPMDGGAW